jgi:FkbM family methyltransferase
MKIKTLKHDFQTGQIEKPAFIAQSYLNFHQLLFDYAAALNETDIKEISIDPDGVIFTIRSSGIRVRCQPGDHRSPPVETFNFADFEPLESAMMPKLFEGEHTFYDIGANIGWHSLTLASRFRQAHFLCFEPIPQTFGHLQENIRLNCLGNIATYNIALSDRAATTDYYFYDACSGNASAVNVSGRDDARKIQCTQTTLDSFVREQGLPNPDFIKCDVEGAEWFVFQGGKDTIAASKPVVMAEILRKWSAKYDYNPNEIFAFFRKLGYQAFTTDGLTLLPFETMTEATRETNFFFLHPEKHALKLQRYAQR